MLCLVGVSVSQHFNERALFMAIDARSLGKLCIVYVICPGSDRIFLEAGRLFLLYPVTLEILGIKFSYI